MLSIGNLLGGMVFSPFAPWLAVAAAASAVTFFVAKAGRDAMDAALAAPSGGNAAGGDKHTAAVAPEILWSYGKAYLSYFPDQASAATAWDSPALDLYRRFILPVDIVFAVSLAAFAVLFWLAMAGASAAASGAQPWLPWFAIFAASISAVYGVADVAEDLARSGGHRSGAGGNRQSSDAGEIFLGVPLAHRRRGLRHFCRPSIKSRPDCSDFSPALRRNCFGGPCRAAEAGALRASQYRLWRGFSI